MNMHKVLFLVRIQLLSLLFLVSLLIQSGRCDDAIVSGNGINVFPVTSADIQLVSETINLRYEGRKDAGWQVDVTLNFQNFGPDTVVQIGFPFDAAVSGADEDEKLPDPNFRTYVDGKEKPVTLKE